MGTFKIGDKAELTSGDVAGTETLLCDTGVVYRKLQISTVASWTGVQSVTASGAATSIDLSLGRFVVLTMEASTTVSFTNGLAEHDAAKIEVVQDATGNRTLIIGSTTVAVDMTATNTTRMEVSTYDGWTSEHIDITGLPISTGGITVYTPDPLRSSVENATGGRCTVLYDDVGLPSYMHIIPVMNAGDLIPGLTGAHPAFLVNTAKIGEIFIGMYAASMIGTRAYSLPRVAPTGNINFDDAKAACTTKGTGWHLMTNWEWAAVALWCVKNGFEPRGNTNYGRHHTNVWETGIRPDAATYLPGDSSGAGNILAGSGPNSWRHNGDANGIADLVGNVWEWVDGFKIDDGQIIMPADNDIALAEGSWPSMFHYLSNEAGTLTLQDTAATVVSTTISVTWASLTKAGGYTESDLLKLALISPAEVEPGGVLYANTSGERMPRRGGHAWDNEGGLGALRMSSVRNYSFQTIGFRPAYLSIP